ncbi:hypothetical protein DRE_06815 [Drechslerella stenobrocha 248]|uniref:Uncharacterized protein n=1 Tax=Drechslerella stenobrocha 248 TaxID=1043628 RepID=W7HWK3_9PEZI|nr:hypothetical protein DRE_06815 [Drechslerella stenobrocha 248]
MAANNSTGIELASLDDTTTHRYVGSSLADEYSLTRAESNSNDPYALSRALKSPSEINLIRSNANGSNTSRKRKNPHAKLANGKELKEFYEAQNEKIKKLLKSIEEHRSEARDTQEDTALKYKIAIWGSFAANVILSGLQVFAAARSSSLSLFATMADSIFDPMSNIILMLSRRAIKKVDSKKFPSGKARLETAGNITFSFVMSAVSLILIVLSARDIGSGGEGETKAFYLESVISVSVAFATKFGLFLYCWALKDIYSDVYVLWRDHRNDLFVNGFGILTSVGGSILRWWIDPAGAIIISVLILGLWLRTAWQEFMLLVGKAADLETQQLITYISMTHSPEIQQLDTVRAYHSGPRLVVEVDVVMDPNCTLKHSHDIAEELQMKLESLPDVERAYVHIDYETTHSPEHFVKKEL